MRGAKVGLKGLWSDPEVDTFAFERRLHQKGYAVVAGLDEVGRGPLAGPVVAASVVLPADCNFQIFHDSKKLTPAARSMLYSELKNMDAAVGIGICTEREIDTLNILQASLLAMRKSLIDLPFPPEFLLVDGTFSVPFPLPQQTLIKGESKSASIAAASIVAKVTRDCLMEEYHLQYPQYNFFKHKGYPTREHRRALKEYGPCAIHRRSFKGVREHYESAGQVEQDDGGKDM